MNRIVLKWLPVVVLFSACSGAKQLAGEDTELVDLDTLVVHGAPQPIIYKGSETRVNDLIHTKLEVRFDMDSNWVYGLAVIDAEPYYHPVDSLVLDARGFTINEVKAGKGDSLKAVPYVNDGDKLYINLGHRYAKGERYRVSVSYIAKPYNRPEKPGNAIQSDRGLYFIKPDSADRKSWQIWSQGETEANSAWFPTIDSPNERMTQEFIITADTIYEIVSNGILLFEADNHDGTKTAYWKMDLPHAPYLAMIAIGEYTVVKDRWRNIDVNYYVYKDYAQYARDIFGNTPEMLEFFSKKTGVDYPWPKFSQIAVKDYVSGAMENTSAVVYGDFVLRTGRELIDQDYEDYISHELFHHWFGDLVTCESWANLPLNESFATYGEYLWIEHKYGRDAADDHLMDDLRNYLSEGSNYPKKMIRYDYREPDEMFDRHSYQKGGLLLHMLRNYLGDKAFFESLTVYLQTYKFTSVEIHQLRQVFEKISGEDLTWFFDQWFFHAGHPDLSISWEYVDSLKQVRLLVKQQQNFKKVPLFRLPVDVDIYTDTGRARQHVIVNKATEEFYFDSERRPFLVNFDAQKTLVCEKSDSKSNREWAYMYRHAPLFADRYEAVNLLAGNSDSISTSVIIEALDDPYWRIRQKAISGISSALKNNPQEIKDKLIRLSQNDEKSRVRSAAIHALSENFNDDDLAGLYTGAISDSSFEVMSGALSALIKNNEKEGMKMANSLEDVKNPKILTAIATAYSKKGEASQNAFFLKSKDKVKGFDRFAFIYLYSDYLERQNDSIVYSGVDALEDIAVNESTWWIRMVAVTSIKDLQKKYEKRKSETEDKLKDFKKDNPNKEIYEKLLDSTDKLLGHIETSIEHLKSREKNEKIAKALGS